MSIAIASTLERESQPSAGGKGAAPSAGGPVPEPVELAFTLSELALVRAIVADGATRAMLDRERRQDLVLAVGELATNSIVHGGGSGRLRLWIEPGSILCEVHDAGHLREPAGRRERPAPVQFSGRGLWLVQELCDQAEFRSSPEHGCTVRVQMRLP